MKLVIYFALKRGHFYEVLKNYKVNSLCCLCLCCCCWILSIIINYVDDMSVEHIRGTNEHGDYIIYCSLKFNYSGNK